MRRIVLFPEFDAGLFDAPLEREELRAVKEEILRHKWYMSEKAGMDVGFEKAFLDWIVNYSKEWFDLHPLALAA